MRIGIAGPKEAGKSEVCRLLNKLYGYKKCSFAEPLRKEVADITLHGADLPEDILYRPHLVTLRIALKSAAGLRLDPYAKPTTVLMRYILQWYGTEFRRAQDTDYWVKQAEQGDHCAFQDLRYPNERACVDVIWYVLNEKAEYARTNDSHATENQIFRNDADVVVANSGTIRELEEQVSLAHMFTFRHEKVAA